jgi:hypothetical protein
VTAFAGDPDLDYILRVVRATPCSQVQVMISPNIAVIRWDGGSMRYLYDTDIAPLHDATRESGKLTIDVAEEFEIPNIQDPNWPEVEDRLVAALNKLFAQDRVDHPAEACGAPAP